MAKKAPAVVTLENVEFDPLPCYTVQPGPMVRYKIKIRAKTTPPAGQGVLTFPTYKLFLNAVEVGSGVTGPDGANRWKADPTLPCIPTSAQVTALIGPIPMGPGSPCTVSSTVYECVSLRTSRVSLASLLPGWPQDFPDFDLAYNRRKRLVTAKTQTNLPIHALCAHIQVWQAGKQLGAESEMKRIPKLNPPGFWKTLTSHDATVGKYVNVIMHFIVDADHHVVLTREKTYNIT